MAWVCVVLSFIISGSLSSLSFSVEYQQWSFNTAGHKFWSQPGRWTGASPKQQIPATWAIFHKWSPALIYCLMFDVPQGELLMVVGPVGCGKVRLIDHNIENVTCCLDLSCWPARADSWEFEHWCTNTLHFWGAHRLSVLVKKSYQVFRQFLCSYQYTSHVYCRSLLHCHLRSVDASSCTNPGKSQNFAESRTQVFCSPSIKLVRFGDPESVTEKFINPILAPSCFGSHTSVPGELKSKLITQGAHNSRFSPSRRCWWPSWERSRWTVGTWASRVGWATRHSSRGFSRERSEKTSCSARILTKLATGKSSRSAPCNRCVGLHCLRVSWQQAHRRVEQLPQQCSRVTVISVGGCIWGCRVILYHYDHKDD